MLSVIIKVFGPGKACLTWRSRLKCIILRKNDAIEDTSTSVHVLNEVVVNRGPSPYLSSIDLFIEGKRITSAQGDGKSLMHIGLRHNFNLGYLTR